MSMTLIAIAAAAATHNVSIDHQGTAMTATYTAHADVRAETIGTHTPNRPDMRRCMWSAAVKVDRALDHSPALARTVASDTRFSGSENGACASADTIESQVIATHKDHIEAHLAQVAQSDRPALIGELDAVRALAVN
ncbi:hypothetical protein J3E64_002389 [Sphingobium sp. OAS761]|uniref:hypothetical protein n=1 Tax=Sphingobium sp. OAS761 TaxID=2817901 RepID=UPI0020A17749|nr:hypothetical protein [Sphingobium sp. OAS761]MCP1470696.1 hypothetical protein [Sphingobium sp. OAS761]